MPTTQRVATEFKAAFSGYDTLDLIDSGFADQQQVAPDPMSFVLTAARADDQAGVRLELKSLGSGKVLLNRILPTSTPDPEAIADAVANVASGVAPVSGLIYGYLDQAGQQSELGTCLTLNDAYYLEQDRPGTWRLINAWNGWLVSAPNRHSSTPSCRPAYRGQDRRLFLIRPDPTEEQAMALARRGGADRADQPLCASRRRLPLFALRRPRQIDPLDAQGL